MIYLKRCFILLFLFISFSLIKANITRGTGYGEIYMFTQWYDSWDGTYFCILHSTNNGASISLQYSWLDEAFPNPSVMSFGDLVSDASLGVLYNRPYSPPGLWISYDYGVNWELVETIGSSGQYTGGCIEGEIYKVWTNESQWRVELHRSTDYGSYFTLVNHSIGAVAEIGTDVGEIYMIQASPWPNIEPFEILYSDDYGENFTQHCIIDTAITGYSYPILTRGVEAGELYMITWDFSYRYNIYRSTDYGQNFEQQFQSEPIDTYFWSVFFTAGREQGSFYVMMYSFDNYGINTDLKIYYSNDNAQTFTEYYHHIDETLPVELSSFTAIVTQSNFVQLQWVTQSETNMIGYNVYRNLLDNLESSHQLNLSIIPAHNSTTEQSYIFTDEEVETGKTYYYWLESMDLDGTNEYFGPASITIENPDVPEYPGLTELKSAYPNPFNPTTTIEFNIKENEIGIFSIFNLKGQIVVSEKFESGNYSFKWNADQLSSGVYFYKLQTESYFKVDKVLMLK